MNPPIIRMFRVAGPRTRGTHSCFELFRSTAKSGQSGLQPPWDFWVAAVPQIGRIDRDPIGLMSSSVPPMRTTAPRPCTWADTPAPITIMVPGRAVNAAETKQSAGRGSSERGQGRRGFPRTSPGRAKVSLPLGSTHAPLYNHFQGCLEQNRAPNELECRVPDSISHAARRQRDPQTGGTMSQGELRIGIVGAGQVTRTRHLPAFRRLPGVKVVAICNRRRESAARVARDFDIPRIYAYWEELIDDRDIDAVVIGAWPYLHCPVTLAALDAGKHVLTQARMAMNAREAQRMLDRSRECPSLTTMIVPSPYGLTGEAFVRSLISDGYIGKLRELHVQSLNGDLADPETPMGWHR